MEFDVAIAGLGGMGSAILAHCAARGASAIGFEQFARAHELGSSSGKSRLFRQAYFEDPGYVPLLRRAAELWRKLEHDTGLDILRQTGVLTVGDEQSLIIAGTRRAAVEHDLPLTVWNSRELQTRYPTLQMLPNELALFESDAGVLNPERAIDAHLKIASAAGAKMHFEVTITGWEASDDAVEIQLSDGTSTRARSLVLALGPWFKKTLADLGVSIRVQRNVQAWFSPSSSAYKAEHFPGFLLDRAGLPAPLYGFPDFGAGLKAAFHGFGQLTQADEIDRTIDQQRDIEPLAQLLEKWMPGAAANFREAKACMYTLTPDEHFVIDHHPSNRNVVLCGGFSGHGFKFAPVIGEIAANLALDGGTRHPIDFLSLRRFTTGA